MAETTHVAFPPQFIVGNRVWKAQTCGTIIDTEQPYVTMDQRLYTIQWDDGTTAKEYSGGLLSIGRHKTRADFEGAITAIGLVSLTTGPRGGFRRAKLKINYDGHSGMAELEFCHRRLWKEIIEPMVKRRGLEIVETKETG